MKEKKEQKIFAGSGKSREVTGKGTDYFKAVYSITVNPDVIMEHVKEYKDKKFVKLNMTVSKELNDYGKDVSLTIDTFVPDSAKGEDNAEDVKDTKAVKKAKAVKKVVEEDIPEVEETVVPEDLPF